MRKIFLVMITALSLAVVAGRESVVRGGEQESAADPGSDAPRPKSAVSPRGKIDLAHATARLEPEEVRREFRISLGPWSTRLSLPESMDLLDLADVSGGVMAAYFASGVEPRHVLTAVIMTAPGAILLSKLLLPETGTPETLGHVHAADHRTDANILDAAARGTRDGLHLALNIAAMLIAFLGLIALVNLGLGKLGTSLQAIFGWILSPVAYLLGVPWSDCRAVGGLLGTRTVLNELIAFQELGKLRANLIDRSFVIASFALCGFANFSSIGIQLGGIGALAPERRHDLARLGLRALLAGTMANFLSACIAGILL